MYESEEKEQERDMIFEDLAQTEGANAGVWKGWTNSAAHCKELAFQI